MSEEKVSTVNHSELKAIFTDYDNHYAPQDGRALMISLAADVLFVYVGKMVDGRGEFKFTFDDDNGCIGVDAEQLYNTLGEILRRSDRYTLERAREGTLPVDHPLRTVVRVTNSITTHGTRIRA